MRGGGEDRGPGADLDDLAKIHHRNPVRDMMHHAQIMRDEQVGQPEIFAQVPQQVQDLRLYGHVQRRDRLVADDEIGGQRQGAGDADPLPLAAGKLVREAPGLAGAKPDARKKIAQPLLARNRIADAMDHQGLDDQLADGHPRVQRAERVLEHDLHAPPQRAHLGGRRGPKVDAVEAYRTRGRLEQPQDQASRRGLAAAAFADQPQRLALGDVEADVVDGQNARPPAGEAALSAGEFFAQPAHAEERSAHAGMPPNS